MGQGFVQGHILVPADPRHLPAKPGDMSYCSQYSGVFLQYDIPMKMGNAHTEIVPNRLNHSAPSSANKNLTLSVPGEMLPVRVAWIQKCNVRHMIPSI